MTAGSAYASAHLKSPQDFQILPLLGLGSVAVV